MFFTQIIEIFKLLLPFTYKTRKLLLCTIVTLLLIVIDSVATTYFPFVWKSIIALNPKTESNTLLWLSALLFCVWFLKKASPHAREIVFFSVTNQAIRDIRRDLIIHTHKVNIRDLENFYLQEIINASTRISQSVRTFLRVSFVSIFPSFIKLIGLSIALFSVHSYAFFIAMSAYSALTLLLYGLKFVIENKRKGWFLSDRVAVVMGENLRNSLYLRFFIKEEERKLDEIFNQEANAWWQHNFYTFFFKLLLEAVYYLGSGISFCVLIFFYIKGQLALDQVVLLYGLISSIHSPLVEVGRNITQFLSSLVDIRKVIDVLNIPEENKNKELMNQKIDIILQDVSFSYTRAPLLNKLNFHFQAGDRVAFIGDIGSGKSTLCKLIAGILEPDSGIILLGGNPVSSISLYSLNGKLIYIPQNLQEDVKDFKKNTKSGGESQLQILERAIEMGPDILILDESLNSMGLEKAQDLLDRAFKKISIVICVTHHKGLLSKMNRVITLNS